MAKTVLGVIQEELARRKQSLADALMDGGAADYASYRHMCGEIRGLTFAHAYVEDLVRRLETGDDPDDSDEP